MSYHITTKMNKTYEEVINSITSELKKEDFGILTEIDAKETLKKKLDADFRGYKILGTCNPPICISGFAG